MEGGSSFILSLPLETVVTESIPNEFAEMQMIDVEGKKMPDSEFGNKRFIVLLVEDNVELLNLTRESLSDWFKVFLPAMEKKHWKYFHVRVLMSL